MRDLIRQLEEGTPIAGAEARELLKLAEPFAARLAAAIEEAWEDLIQDEFEEAVMASIDTDITSPASERAMDRAYIALRRAFVKALPPMLGHGLTAR